MLILPIALAAERCYNTGNNSDDGDHAVQHPRSREGAHGRTAMPVSGLEGAARQDMEFAPELPR